jgi:hypothetical protein
MPALQRVFPWQFALSVLARQCLPRRLESINRLRKEVGAWEEERNEEQIEITWQCTTANARIKLHRLYPVIQK